MRNSTLGSKGMPLFLFALLLFSGTYLYGQQNCPTVVDEDASAAGNQQTYCYLQTVADLQASANGDGIRWYRTASSTNPIPENELLQTGSYFAGNATGNCSSRVEVSVSVDNIGAPTTQFGVIFQPCQYSDDDFSTVADLIALIHGNEVEIFTEEFSGEPLDPATTLEDDTSYFAGQRNPDTGCRTSRLALRYDPVHAEAPTGESLQTFCPGATVGDLEAQATNTNTQAFRWYSTATSYPALATSTPLINGETYYASQIINRSDSNQPPCESVERFAVEVIVITDGLGEDSTDNVLCRLDVADTATEDQVEDVFMSFLENPIPGGTFSPSIAEITAQFNGGDGIGTFSTTYTVAGGTTCSDSADLAVTVSPAANAGESNTGTIVCRNDLPPTLSEVQLSAILQGFFAGDVTPGGDFSPSLEDLVAEFNSGDGLGTFSTTYTVGIGSCQDSAQYGMIVIGTDAAGNDNTDTVLCRSDLAETATEADVRTLFTSLLDGAVLGGNFNPSIAQLTSDFNSGEGVGVFSTTYTIGEGTSCEDSAVISVTVSPAANAGADNTSTILCRTDMADTATEADVRNFFTLRLLDDTATSGGTFSPSIAELTAQFNAADGIGTFSTTYTVGTGSCLDTAELSVTVIGNGAAGNDNTNTVLCRSDLAGTATEADVRTLFTSLLDGAALGGNFDPSIAQLTSDFNSGEGVGVFSTTYTIGEGTSCEDSAVISVTVSPTANAGTDNTSTILCRSEMAETATEADVRNFFTLRLLDDTATTGGIFSPSIPELTAQFNAGGGIGTFSTTYTVGQGTACEDSAELAVTVIGSRAAGNDNIDSEICFNTETATESEVEDLFKGLLSDAVSGGTFSPDFATLTSQINNSDGTGTFSTTYTIGEGTACEDSAELAVTITGNGGNAGADNTSTVLCRSEVADTPTSGQVKTFFESLLDDTATTGGVFSPSIAELTAQFNAGDGIGTFSTTYTVGQGTACEDSAELAVTVIGSGAAGNDNIDSEVCFNTETATESEVEDLFKGRLSDAVSGGTFSPDFATLTSKINNSDGTGTFSTTYTIGEGTACEDSAELAVTIIGNGGDAGADNTSTVFCRSGLAETATEAQVLGVFEGLLDDSATVGGTFSPSIADLTAEFNAGDGIGTFSTTYTVGEGTACEDSAELAVTVIGTSAAGADNLDTVLCRTQVAETPTVTQVRSFFLNLLDENVSKNGTFSPSIEDITADFNAGEGVGTFNTTYTIGAGTSCEDSAELSVTVLEALDAGQNAIVNLEEGATETVDLFDSLGGTPDAGGVWTDAEGTTVDGTFDPTTETEGVYTYTITSDNGCIDSATVTVIIGDEFPDCTTPPIAPTVTAYSTCAVSGATVADLADNITGDDGATFNVYTDAEMQNQAVDTDVLVDGTYYVTQLSAAGCESATAELVVTLTDTDAPTLSTGGNVFCEFDRATLADLEENINADGAITWYTSATGTDTYNTSEVLQDGVTYYASSTPTGDCESSNRLAVNITLETCEILIPEAFSPNGDNINDKFVVPNLSSEYPNHKMEIYNRWGEPVFIGQVGEQQGWDGTSTEGSFGSGVLPAGVYFYILYYNDGTTPPTQGRVYLSR